MSFSFITREPHFLFILILFINNADFMSRDFGFGLPALPCINGRDLAGKVVKAPKAPSRFRTGDIVSFFEAISRNCLLRKPKGKKTNLRIGDGRIDGLSRLTESRLPTICCCARLQCLQVTEGSFSIRCCSPRSCLCRGRPCTGYLHGSGFQHIQRRPGTKHSQPNTKSAT